MYKTNTNMGYVLENIVFLELKRRGYEIYIGKNDAEEVNFVGSKKDNPSAQNTGADISEIQKPVNNDEFMPLDDDDSLPF